MKKCHFHTKANKQRKQKNNVFIMKQACDLTILDEKHSIIRKLLRNILNKVQNLIFGRLSGLIASRFRPGIGYNVSYLGVVIPIYVPFSQNVLIQKNLAISFSIVLYIRSS